jgi:ATP/maltotriose-dependent transcriptional regulator MalT/DNA-binding SARP family transcriptional activator
MKPKRAPLGKTTRPSLGGVLPRERVFKLLEESRACRAVWISGPPGCGKTTAVASWLDHAAIPCLWYQLDEGDADVATFFYYLGLAATEGRGKATEPLPLLTPEYHAGLAVFTRRYFQALYARLESPFAVVFDGYHEVAAFSQFHEVMRDALGELPPGGCAVLVSRGDPPPTLARLRANRGLATLGWDDLRLTREETESIVRRRRPEASREMLDELHARTQGWAAGLVLMLEQAKVLGPIAEPPDLGASQLVFDYLAGEILQKSDTRTQEFLLRTAYLPQMTAAIAEELSGDGGAAQILAGLHRSNYFVTLRQGRPEPAYQYHPMFRDFLRARVQETHAKEARRRLQRASAAAMEAAGQAEDAIALYRDSHEWDEMARIIGAHAEAMLGQGRGETLVRWIEELPPEARDRHPWIIYWSAASRAPLAPRESRLLYEKAFERFAAARPPDLTGMVLAASGAMDAILYELDDFSLMDRWIARLDEMLKGSARLPSAAVEARVACSMFSALTLRQPHRRDVREWIERALARAQEAEDPNLRIYVGLLAALTLMWTGLHGKAAELIEAMRRLSQLPGVTPFSLTTLKNVDAMYSMLTADKDRCLLAMREGLEITRATGARTWLFQMLVYGYGAALGRQDLDTAAGLAKQFEAQARAAGRFNLVFYHHFQAWEAALRNDLMRALQEEKTALRMAVEVGCPYFEVLCRLALAEMLAECGDERKSIAQLQQLRPIVEAIDNRHLGFTCLVVFGRLALEHGRQRPGLRALGRGLALGREYGYTHFLWWRPAAMARTCALALEAGIETDYVKSLIRRRGLVPEAAARGPSSWPWAFRVETLGEFRLLRHDAPLAAQGKAQRRPLELLKVLIAHGGERVSEDRLTAALWPRIDGDSAHRSFTSALHRLRRLLGEERAVVLHEGKLTLDRRYFWLDAWAFDELVDEVERALKRARPPLDAARIERHADRLLGLYRGPFLASEPDESWYLPRRERLRQRFVRAMTAIGRFWEESGQWDRALASYEKCLEADPLAEGFYRHLMICYRRLERRAEAIEAFHRCRKALSSLNVEPSAETRALYEKLT